MSKVYIIADSVTLKLKVTLLHPDLNKPVTASENIHYYDFVVCVPQARSVSQFGTNKRLQSFVLICQLFLSGHQSTIIVSFIMPLKKTSEKMSLQFSRAQSSLN